MNRIEILPNLWISSIKNANNKGLNILCNVNILINAENDLDFLDNHTNYNSHISSNIEKYEILKTHEYLIETTNFIKSNLINNKGILIFCNDALQKSPLIVVAYLIRFGNMAKIDAINIIKSKYSNVFYPNIKYEHSLDKISNLNINH